MFLVSVPVAFLHIIDCRGFSTRKSSVIFTGHLGTMSYTTRGVAVEYSYRDHLIDEIEILRLMLYRDEFLTLGPKTRKQPDSLLSKLEESIKELADLDEQ